MSERWRADWAATSPSTPRSAAALPSRSIFPRDCPVSDTSYPSREVTKPNARPVSIVTVEDDEGHARLIERNIRRAGVNNVITSFRNGTDGLGYPDGRPAPARGRYAPMLILLDLNQPDMTGVDIQGRSRRTSTPGARR